MRRTKKIAILAIIAMVLTMIPASLFAAPTDSDRLAGADRIQTALAIADAGTWGNTVILAAADNENLVDALAAAPLAGQENAPILLTYKNKLDPAVKQKIIDLKATKVYVIGAAYALAEEINAIDGVTVEMLTGDNRQVTAAAINAQLTNPSGTFIVGYDAIPDALSVASYAAKNNYAIAIAGSDGTYEDSYYGAAKYIIGGTAKVKDISGVERIAGADRYATNKAVSDKFSFSYERIYVANGVSLVDALVAAPLAAKYNAFVVLTDGKTVASPAGVTAATKVIAVGGTNAVSDAVKDSVYVPPAVLSVESVSAINCSQVQVVFNKEVTKTSAEAVGNYAINGTPFIASGVFGGAGSIATLQSDNKTVILEARSAAVANNTSFTLKITGVTDTNYNTIATTYKTVTALDQVAPSIVSVVATAGAAGTKDVAVTLSEPVALGTIGAYKINGVNAVAAIDATNKCKVNLVAASALAAGSTNTLTVAGLSDGINAAPLLSQSFTVTGDQTGPAIVSVEQVGSTIKVVFDEKISATNFAALTRGVASTDDITLTKQGDATPYITAAPALDPNDTTNKTVLFTFLNTVYGTGNTANVVFTFKNIEDVNGNKVTPYSNSMTLTKDTVKPTLVSSVLDTSDNKTIYLTFSEAVSDPNLTMSGLTVVDNSTAQDVTVTVLAGAAAGDDIITKADWTAVPAGVTSSKYVKLVLPVALSASRTYTFTIPANVVADTSTNKMLSTTFQVSTTASSDTTKPTVAKGAAAINVVGGKNVIHVLYSENVQLADAINTANYVLNGSALPDGTVITNESAVPTDTKGFAITLPEAGVASDCADASLLVTGVRDIAGNAVLPTTLTSWNAGLDLVDTKVPTLVSAKAIGNTKLELTFSEPVTLVADGAATFEITVTDGTNTGNIDLDVDAVAYLGNTATITMAGDTLGDINFNLAYLTIAANAVQDKAATPNKLVAIAAADAVRVTDAFVDTTGGAVATTNGTGTDNTFTEVAVNITAPTNATVDRIVKYEIYMLPATATDYTTVADVESHCTKLATFLSTDCGAAKDLTAASGLYLSDGTTAIATFNATVDTYVVAIDALGNKALISQTPSGVAINVAD